MLLDFGIRPPLRFSGENEAWRGRLCHHEGQSIMLAGLSWAGWPAGRQLWPRVALDPIGKYTDHDGKGGSDLAQVYGIGEFLKTGDSHCID